MSAEPGIPEDRVAGKTAKILVVDDDPEMRSMLVAALSKEDRSISDVPDGEKAIERIKKGETFHLIVSDIRMPRRDGVAVLNEAQKTCPQTRVILITAFGEIEEYLDVMDGGAYEYINKPVKMAELCKAVDRALAQA